MAYWDTSALLKLYIEEADSAYFDSLASQLPGPIVSTHLARVEVLCALYQKENAGHIGPGAAAEAFQKFLADLHSGRIDTVPPGPDVWTQVERVLQIAFHRPRPVLFRSLDAIHVASALASSATVVVATDRRLREVATSAGLRVLP